MKFTQYQGDPAELPEQAPGFFLSLTKRFSLLVDPGSLVQLEYIFCTLPLFAFPNAKRLRWRVSGDGQLVRETVHYFSNELLCPKLERELFSPALFPMQHEYCWYAEVGIN